MRKQLTWFNKWTIKLKISITHIKVKISITHLLILHSVYSTESVTAQTGVLSTILVKIIFHSYHLIGQHYFCYSQAVIEYIFEIELMFQSPWDSECYLEQELLKVRNIVFLSGSA